MAEKVIVIKQVFDKNKFLSDLAFIGVILMFFGIAIFIGWILFKLIQWWEGIIFVILGIAFLLMFTLLFIQRYFVEKEVKPNP